VDKKIPVSFGINNPLKNAFFSTALPHLKAAQSRESGSLFTWCRKPDGGYFLVPGYFDNCRVGVEKRDVVHSFLANV
jgi:hypothetical protein